MRTYAGKSGLWESGLRLFNEMLDKGLEPDLVTYSTLIKVSINACLY